MDQPKIMFVRDHGYTMGMNCTAKGMALDEGSLTASQPTPGAAKTTASASAPKRGKPTPEGKCAPPHVRWPTGDVKAAKLAAIQLDFHSVSDFMLSS
jgi:hypothetical protein